MKDAYEGLCRQPIKRFLDRHTNVIDKDREMFGDVSTLYAQGQFYMYPFIGQIWPKIWQRK